MGIATFPTDQFLYAKLDKQMRYVYCNAFHEALFLRPRSEFIGVSAEELALAGASPKCMIHLMFDTVRERGFANAILPFIDEEGKSHWGMIDMTRRFGADDDSGQLGYEYVAYPTTDAAVRFFSPLFDQLHDEEKRGNTATALSAFQASIEQSGMIYEELVHTLQAQ